MTSHDTETTMTRIALVDPATAPAATADLLAQVRQALGAVPNVARLMANSPAVLQAWLQFDGALSRGLLDAKLHSQIKLATSQENACDYCLAALCAIGSKQGLTTAQLLDARKGKGSDARSDAAVRFGRRVAEASGRVTAAEVEAARAAGLSDGELVEVVASVVLGIFTNYLNLAFATEVDFASAGALAR